MTNRELQDRVSQLEAKVAKLESAIESQNGHGPNAWVRAMDRWAGDTDIQAVFEHARKIREAERAKARKPRRKRRRASA